MKANLPHRARTVNTKITIAPHTRTRYIARMDKPDPPARKTVTLPESLWAEVADFRYANRIPSEAEAIRRLLQAALRGVGKKGKRDGG